MVTVQVLTEGILPVFAGMILRIGFPTHLSSYSPRIRGDDPLPRKSSSCLISILPVFAGMIPDRTHATPRPRNSPRIRGDDPAPLAGGGSGGIFSPYSRG